MWKEGNLSRVDCNRGDRLRDLEVRNIGRENSKRWKEKEQVEKKEAESTRTVGNRREIVGGLGMWGSERVGE